MKKIRVSVIILTTFILIIILNSITYSKYIIENNLVVAKLDIDRTLPTGTVQYSTVDNESEKIKVIITLSEPINDVEGWELNENRIILSKTFNNSIIETIKITDMSGNENIIEINNEFN